MTKRAITPELVAKDPTLSSRSLVAVPHYDRVSAKLLGTDDGQVIYQSGNIRLEYQAKSA